jgi:NitT/TauT family transport system permease protein
MKAKSAWAGLGLLILLLLVLELGVKWAGWDARFFPAPSRVLSHLADLADQALFREHLHASLSRWGLGLGLAVGISLALIVLASLWSWARGFLNACAGLLYPLPKSAIFPMFLLLFGIDGAAHVALIALGALSLILATVLAGFHRLEAAGYLPLARNLRLSRWHTLRFVTLPGLVPDFVQGLKLGSSYALVLMVVTEMMMTRQGLGVMLWAAWDNFRIVELYSILYLICFLGVGIFVMMETLGEWAMEFQRAV